MEKILILWIFAVLLGVQATKLDENLFHCAESCLKINPYENISASNHDTNTTSQHHMVRHCAKRTSDGKCECDWEKILTVTGDCVCQNPRHKIDEENRCVCDKTKCDAQMKRCKGTLTVQNDPYGCCPQYNCEICPNDSYHSNLTSTAEDDAHCICYPCKMTNCRTNQTTVVIRKGNQKPGTCCDLYKCEDLNQTNTCFSNKIYKDGDSWMEGTCTLYRCENGVIFHEQLCDHPVCFSNDKVYENRQSWTEDECTNCTCEDGVKKCVAHFCKESPSVTIKPEIEDCPPLVMCKKSCVFGFRLNRKGCEICKCRQPDAKTVQDILRAVNCTVESCDLAHVATSNCSAGNYNASVEQCPACAESSYSQIVIAALITIIVILAIGLIALTLQICRERKRALCTHNVHAYSYRPSSPDQTKYIQIQMFDANLNTEKPMLCRNKNVEQKDFR